RNISASSNNNNDLSHKRHTATHVNTWRRHRTHTHTHAHASLRSFVNLSSAFIPSRTVLPPGPPMSSGQLLSARGPSEPSVSVRDGQDCSVLSLHMFFCCGS